MSSNVNEFLADVILQVLLCPNEHETCGWQVKLYDPIKHGALLERFEDLKIIKCAIQVLLLRYITYLDTAVVQLMRCCVESFVRVF